MKSLAVACLLLPTAAFGGDTIPLRDPAVAEPRPAWWLECWAAQVVVIQGSIRFDLAEPPDLELKMSSSALQSQFQKTKDRERFQRFSKFLIGDVRIEKLLFASSGVAFLNFNVVGMKEGRVTTTKVLIPAYQSPGRLLKVFHLEPGKENKGVFIFQYGSLVTQFPLVFKDRIPKEEMENAQAVFDYRDKHNYHER